MKGIAWVTVVVAVAVGSGCGPKITRFEVAPQAYCSTTAAIRVRWATENGDATIRIEPPDAAPRRVPASGELTIAAPHPMTVTLTVSKGGVPERRTVAVGPIAHHPLAGRTERCAEGWVETPPFTFGGGSQSFDVRAVLSALVNRCAPDADAAATCRRKIEVQHGAQRWLVAPDSVLDVSTSGARVEGEWILRGELLPGEICGTASAAAAEDLELSVELNCEGE